MVVSRRAFVGGMLLLPVGIAACGEETPPPDTAAASTGKPLPAEAWRAFADELQQRAAAGAFSGAVLVANHGKPLLEQGYGMADRQRGLANTAQTKFPIASLGKMFTGVAIAQLVEQDKLSFTDTIEKYALGFSSQIAGTVTIHHLLTQTAGMDDAALRRRPEPPYTLAGLLERIVEAPLQSNPGRGLATATMASSSSAPSSNASPGRTTRLRPRAPLHPRRHGRHRCRRLPTQPDPRHGPRVHAGRQGRTTGAARIRAGLDRGVGNLRANDEPQVGNPSGGAWSTVGDLLKFAQALTGHRLLGSGMTDTVLAGKVATGRPGLDKDTYAYGFADARINGVRIVGHNGGSPGYEAQLDLYPDRGDVVVMLTNQDQVLTPVLQRSQAILTRSP